MKSNHPALRLLCLKEIREMFPKTARPSEETLRRYVRAGSLRGRKVGGTYYSTLEEIQRWLAGDGDRARTAKGKHHDK